MNKPAIWGAAAGALVLGGLGRVLGFGVGKAAAFAYAVIVGVVTNAAVDTFVKSRNAPAASPAASAVIAAAPIAPLPANDKPVPDAIPVAAAGLSAPPAENPKPQPEQAPALQAPPVQALPTPAPVLQVPAEEPGGPGTGTGGLY